MTPNDVKIVADNIDDFIEVPNGIDRLRTAIFALAISGKFAPAGVSSWKSSTLGEVCSVKKGKKPELYETEGDKMLPYLEAKFIRGAKPAKFAKISDKNSVMVTEDDLIIICDGSNSGEFFTGVKGVLASTMGVLNYDRKIVSKKYLEVFLESNFELFNKARKGAAIPHLDFNLFNSLAFPLPSLEEQDRIVAKVQQVMKQLDELEMKKRERDEVRARLARSAMHSLGNGQSKIAFEQLTELIKTPADIEELEKALRMLAVFGHLTSKSSGEDIPASWKWMKWGDVLSDEKYSMKRGPFGSALRKDYFVPDGVMVYEQYNAIHDVDRARYFISDEKYKELEAFTVRPGDLIISCSGTLGRIAELHANSRVGIINQALLKVKLNSKVVLNDYFILLFRSDFIQDRIYLEALGTAMTNMVNVKTLKTILLPIPPLPEQKRIVKKFEEVIDLINRLKKVIEI